MTPITRIFFFFNTLVTLGGLFYTTMTVDIYALSIAGTQVCPQYFFIHTKSCAQFDLHVYWSSNHQFVFQIIIYNAVKV